MVVADDFHAIIIGAGSAGLLTAQSLQKRGIKCTVYEQDAALDARSRDWNFGIYWAQVPLQGDCVPDELSKKIIEQCQVDRRLPSPDEVMPVYNGHSGEHMKDIPSPNNIRLHRRNFLRLLRTNTDVHYGKRLQRIESNGSIATAHFEDGTSASGNLLIGAEGAHSKVREFLLGDEEAKLEPSPIYASSTMAKLPKETAEMFLKLHHRYILNFTPAGEFMWTGVHDNFEGTGPGDWNFMILQSWVPKHEHDPSTLQGPAILSSMKERVENWAEPFRSFVKTIPEGTKCWHNQLSYWVPRPWDNHNGTVTLVGDAAHSMTFHRGQGLNNAIHDASSLARHFSEKGPNISAEANSAVTAYEHELFERGKLAVESSNQNSLAVHDWDTLLKSPLMTIGLKKPESKVTVVSNGTDVQK